MVTAEPRSPFQLVDEVFRVIMENTFDTIVIPWAKLRPGSRR